MSDYEEFLLTKVIGHKQVGFEVGESDMQETLNAMQASATQTFGNSIQPSLF